MSSAQNESMLNGARAVSFSVSSSLAQSAGNVARLKFIEGTDLQVHVAQAAEAVKAARAAMTLVTDALLKISVQDFVRIQNGDI